MSDRQTRRSACARLHRVDEWEYRLLMAVGFAVFLLAAVVIRLLPRRLRPAGAPGSERGSVVAAAREAAGASIPFAFMG